MEGFTIVDAVVAVIVLMSSILAYSRGFVREIMAIAGWVAAAVVAFIFAPKAEPLIRQVEFLDKYLGDSCELSIIAAFLAVFALSLIVMSIFTPIFSSAVQRSALGGTDQGLGFLFGALRGILLVAIAFSVYNRVLVSSTIPVVENSQSAKVFASLETRINQEMPQDVPSWIRDRYRQLIGDCGAPVTSPTNDTGAKTLTAPETTGN